MSSVNFVPGFGILSFLTSESVLIYMDEKTTTDVNFLKTHEYKFPSLKVAIQRKCFEETIGIILRFVIR